MKKYVIVILCLITLACKCYAQGELSFVYINGSNNNDKVMTNWFFQGIRKLHPEMKKSFENSYIIYDHLLEGGKYHIKDVPIPCFWGNLSHEEITAIEDELATTNIVSPKLAQTVRSFFAKCMHDAIWVSKFQNMYPVLEILHKIVIDEYNKGNKIILFGYSAGSFVTYEYMLHKFNYIDTQKFFGHEEFPQYIKDLANSDIQPQNTCLDALTKSRLITLNLQRTVSPNENHAIFKSQYKNLDFYTKNYCAPEGAIKGVVNFASPLVLFYSNIGDPKYQFSFFNKLLYEYIFEHDFAWLTVNFADDPLGFPTTGNLGIEEIEKLIEREINPRKGFIYDKSNVNSMRTFAGSHTSYWANSKRFSKTVVKAYEEAQAYFYDN